MTFHLANRRRGPAKILGQYPNAVILDVTSRGPHPWVRFSPFFPHGGIPVPFSPGTSAQSVEGVWQGLKVFAKEDIDRSKFDVTTMRGLKRTVGRLGTVQGHRRGVGGSNLLSYSEARRQIYLPVYRWVLDNRLGNELAELKRLGEGSVVLLDYETNVDIENLARPLSHAGLVIRYLTNDWP